MLLVAAAVGSLVLLAYPMWRRYSDDQGDGMAVVLLPPSRLPARWRALAFGLLFAGFNVLVHSMKGGIDPNHLYALAVERLASRVVSAQSELNGYFANFDLGLRLLVAGTMLCMAVVCRGSFLRRLLVAAQVLWYLLAMLLLDALMSVVSVVTGFPIAPSTLLSNFVAVALGFIGMARMLFLNFALPRPTAVPFSRRPRVGTAITLVAITLASMALCGSALALLYRLADPRFRSLLVLLAPIPFGYGAVVVRSAMLLVLAKVVNPAQPPVGSDRPPIEIIIPAYNEEEVIAETLRAIDAAAGRYGGPVNVVLSNDGSTDRTKVVAAGAIASFSHASGRIIDVKHGGKSATLNSALAETTADLVIRIDADTLLDEWALHYIPRWFKDSKVGLVESMIFPRWRRSPFPRMRLFEELKQFGLLHRTVGIVDGINVVPGVFTAFRRAPAVALGGFTSGMNGEDGDFTLRMSRLGWEVRQDPKILVYEDVPPTYLEIREQRVRWDRATIHNQARHGPYRAGLATPKVWYSQSHQFFTRMFAPIRLMLPIYLFVVAAFNGVYTKPLLLTVGAWFIGQVSFMAFESLLATVYGQKRRIAWVLLWPLWQICLVLFSTESWLSLPGRPASLVRGMRPVEVAAPAIH